MSFRYSQFGNEDGTGSITVYKDGDIKIAEFDHVNYENICELAQDAWETYKRAKATDNEAILSEADALAEDCYALFDLSPQLAAKFHGITDRVSIRDGRAYFDGDEVSNALSEHLLRALDQGDEIEWLSLANFWENLAQNPNEHSRNELFDWLKKYETFTITLDGCIIGYKGVDEEFKSSFTGEALVNGEVVKGHIPYVPGTRVEMSRSVVRHNPSQGCSVGLHVATHKFANGWDDKTVSVKVNPRDVVSVPQGDTEKMRVCRLDVIEVVEAEYDAVVLDVDEDALSEAPQAASKTEKAPAKGNGSSQSALDTEPVYGALTKLLTNPSEFGFEDGIKITEVTAYLGKKFKKQLPNGTTKDSIRRFKARHGI